MIMNNEQKDIKKESWKPNLNIEVHVNYSVLFVLVVTNSFSSFTVIAIFSTLHLKIL